MVFRAIIPDAPEADKKTSLLFCCFYVLPTTRHDDTGYIEAASFY
jgi:hypothetical protein